MSLTKNMQHCKIDPKTILQRCTKFQKQSEAENWLINMLVTVTRFTLKNSICAVFDIDGTMLKFKDDKSMIPLRNQMMFNLFTICRRLQIPIYIITARPDGVKQRKWTIDQLKSCGYPPDSYVELRMMPLWEWNKINKVENWNFSDYKFKERQRISQNNNKTIILNAGDQWSDLFRVPPCATSAEEHIVHEALHRLPNTGIYVGSLLDLSWFSVKLPH